MKIDLTKGVTETPQYKAWVFPGGEIHVQLKRSVETDYDIAVSFDIITRLNTSQDIMFLLIFTDTLRKDYPKTDVNLFLPYMPYQQADRNFGKNECFSLKTMCNIINSMNYTKVTIYDNHSDVSPALLNNCEVVDNSVFINRVLDHLYLCEYDRIVRSPLYSVDPIIMHKKEASYPVEMFYNDIIMLASDAGSYKKIFKLCEKIGFTGQIESCSKSRDHKTGNITMKVPKFESDKIVLIIDDICLAGNTFLNIREKLNNEKVYLAVSHGIFNDNVDRLEKEFTQIYTTNSRRNEAVGKNIKVINII